MELILRLTLQRYLPRIYSLAKMGYWNYRKVKETILGTRVQERFWERRHLKGGSDWGNPISGNSANSWVESYWRSRHHRHRELLMEIIQKHCPIETVLEVGCNCGPNLYMIAKEFESARVVGVDINRAAIEAGTRFFRSEGIENVRMLVRRADELDDFSDKSFDIVFTDAVLIYVGPDKIKKVIQEMIRVARKAIIFIELHREGGGSDCLSLGEYDRGYWIRDYSRIIESLNAKIKDFELEKIPKDAWEAANWQHWGYTIEIVL